MAGTHKIRIGRVISDKMDKTVSCGSASIRHIIRLYHKTIKKSVKYKVHDENKET